MKACSFVPAATQMIYDMGLEQDLYGVTFECPSDKPKIVRSILEDNNYTSEEIDRIISEYKKSDKSLYYVEMDLLQSVAPDVVFTQSVCDVCQIGTSYVERAIGSLTPYPQIVPLMPRNLENVFRNALEIAEAFGKPENGVQYINQLNERIDNIIDTLRKHRSPLRRVMVMEWMKPIYNCGHWIPYQISLAGGADALSNPSGYSVVTSWDRVVEYNPEVLVVAPCGFNVERAAKEVEVLTTLSGWNDLNCVVSGQVYVADADLFTQPCAAGLVDGIEVLAALFHPQIFEVPTRLTHKAAKFTDLLTAHTV
ncbi:MAG: transporter substrate-binding protein [Bacilli bacterium]|nr:transporter substrate-binding protein [Bacilli bacterium]